MYEKQPRFPIGLTFTLGLGKRIARENTITDVLTTWIATRVEHSLSSEGYVCHVELEQPDAGQQNVVEDDAP